MQNKQSKLPLHIIFTNKWRLHYHRSRILHAKNIAFWKISLYLIFVADNLCHNYVRVIFVAHSNNENYLTTKISQSTVILQYHTSELIF